MSTVRIAVKTIQSRPVPVAGNDIDTDRVIPARFMKSITFEGLGQYAFYDARFNADGSPKDHPFNKPEYQGAGILVVNKNFGCGSSREHAPQALQKFGIKAVIGESFAEIFAGNCTALGIPAVKVSEADARKLQELAESNPAQDFAIDLEAKRISAGSFACSLDMPESYRKSLVQGTWDSTGVLLENLKEIHATAKGLPYVSGFA